MPRGVSSKGQEKRIAVQRRKDTKVELWEKQFDNVVHAIDYALGLANKPLSVDVWDALQAERERTSQGRTPHDLVYWTERISLGGEKWVIKVSTWIPNKS